DWTVPHSTGGFAALTASDRIATIPSAFDEVTVIADAPLKSSARKLTVVSPGVKAMRRTRAFPAPEPSPSLRIRERVPASVIAIRVGVSASTTSENVPFENDHDLIRVVGESSIVWVDSGVLGVAVAVSFVAATVPTSAGDTTAMRIMSVVIIRRMVSEKLGIGGVSSGLRRG
ncbi:hypothetical protein, partial [Haloferax sp. ATCC BAA-644]|uniref:hypothetical protein n=1 Tax=Haloferax sp. ATCC BAA-644 TaxID=1227462 RepID=UPI001955476E